MPTYPDYVHQTLARAREEGQWHAAQADASALCFDVLALFPDCREATNLVYELFCDDLMVQIHPSLPSSIGVSSTMMMVNQANFPIGQSGRSSGWNA